ncbi:MAG: transglutaminase domain-containing protein [Pirellulaceae bacterium]
MRPAIWFTIAVIGMLFVASLASVQAEERRRVTFTLWYRLIPGRGTEALTWTNLVPTSIEGRQVIHDLEYSREPTRLLRRNGNTYAVYEFEDLSRPIDIQIRITADLIRRDYSSLRTAKREERLEVESIHERTWLRAENHLEVRADEIREAAESIEGETREERVRNTAEFVSDRLRYSGYQPDPLGALRALQFGEGDCSEFSDLFVTLCRAQGIPARTSSGLLIVPSQPDDTTRHRWVEVYFDELGWVPVDPLRHSRRGRTLWQLPNEYLYLSNLRNDPVLDNFEAALFRYRGDPIEFETGMEIHSDRRVEVP